jgi:hypothetical protein
VRCDRYFLLLLLAIGVSSLLSDLSVSSNNPFDSDDGGIMKIVICLSNVMQAGEDGGYCDEVSTAEPLPIAPGAGGGGGRARRARISPHCASYCAPSRHRQSTRLQLLPTVDVEIRIRFNRMNRMKIQNKQHRMKAHCNMHVLRRNVVPRYTDRR